MFLFAWLLSACLAQPATAPVFTAGAPDILAAGENRYAPQSGDEKLDREGVVLISLNLIERVDLNPARIEVDFFGSLPGVCNALRLQVKPPDDQYRIVIEAYSVRDPKTKCDNVFQQVETSILLGVYSPGRYSVWSNNVLIGDFISY